MLSASQNHFSYHPANYVSLSVTRIMGTSYLDTIIDLRNSVIVANAFASTHFEKQYMTTIM